MTNSKVLNYNSAILSTRQTIKTNNHILEQIPKGIYKKGSRIVVYESINNIFFLNLFVINNNLNIISISSISNKKCNTYLLEFVKEMYCEGLE